MEERQDVATVPVERIETKILLIRGQKVMMDRDLAMLYGVSTKALNQAVQRNIERFPSDFLFQLTRAEYERLKSQFVISSLRSQFVTSKVGRGGVRWLPFVFTEQGVAMLSSVLRSKRAIFVNIQIMRTFTKLRELVGQNEELRLKIEALESRYDQQFKSVFDAIRRLFADDDASATEIGFKSPP
ncbi:MAG: ORF6N domain-containing protein [Patescibacteria group bacterium]